MNICHTYVCDHLQMTIVTVQGHPTYTLTPRDLFVRYVLLHVCMYVVFLVCSSFPHCSLPGVSNCKLCTKHFCNYRKPLQEFVSLELSVCVKKCHVPRPLEDSIQSTNYVHIIISVHACRLLHCHLDSSPLHR